MTLTDGNKLIKISENKEIHNQNPRKNKQNTSKIISYIQLFVVSILSEK